MNKFMLNITASSGEYYQGDCEDLVLPISDGVYGIQAGHSPVLVAIHMGILHFEVNEMCIRDSSYTVPRSLPRWCRGDCRDGRHPQMRTRRGTGSVSYTHLSAYALPTLCTKLHDAPDMPECCFDP